MNWKLSRDAATRSLKPFYCPTKKCWRESLPEPGDIRSFRAIQRRLPEQYRMRVFLCLQEGKVCAGVIASAIGETGLYLFGATGDIGTRTRPSEPLQWRIIEWLKRVNCRTYDLHGTDRVSNPGVYAFKQGLCGRNGREIEYCGSLDAYDNRLTYLVFKAGDMPFPFTGEYASTFKEYRCSAPPSTLRRHDPTIC